MTPKVRFIRAVRYLFVPGNDTPLQQVLADQINQPAVEENQRKLPGQRILFYAALIMVILGVGTGLWALLINR